MRKSKKKRWVVYYSRDFEGTPYAIFKTESAAQRYIAEESQQFYKDTHVVLRLSYLPVDYFKE